jgi:hypothetical protein
MVKPLGLGPVWLGWLMIAALAWSAIPSVVLGRAKLPLAAELHDKVLYADAKMNRANSRAWASRSSACRRAASAACAWVAAAAWVCSADRCGRTGGTGSSRGWLSAVADLGSPRPSRETPSVTEPMTGEKLNRLWADPPGAPSPPRRPEGQTPLLPPRPEPPRRSEPST